MINSKQDTIFIRKQIAHEIQTERQNNNLKGVVLPYSYIKGNAASNMFTGILKAIFKYNDTGKDEYFNKIIPGSMPDHFLKGNSSYNVYGEKDDVLTSIKAPDINKVSVYYDADNATAKEIESVIESRSTGGYSQNESTAKHSVIRCETYQYFSPTGYVLKEPVNPIHQIYYYNVWPKLTQDYDGSVSEDYKRYCLGEPGRGIIKNPEELQKTFEAIIELLVEVASVHREAINIIAPGAFFDGLTESHKKLAYDLFTEALLEVASSKVNSECPGIFLNNSTLSSFRDDPRLNKGIQVVQNPGDATAPGMVADKHGLSFKVAQTVNGESARRMGGGCFSPEGMSGSEERISRLTCGSLLLLCSSLYNPKLLNSSQYTSLSLKKGHDLSQLAKSDLISCVANMKLKELPEQVAVVSELLKNEQKQQYLSASLSRKKGRIEFKGSSLKSELLENISPAFAQEYNITIHRSMMGLGLITGLTIDRDGLKPLIEYIIEQMEELSQEGPVILPRSSEVVQRQNPVNLAEELIKLIQLPEATLQYSQDKRNPNNTFFIVADRNYRGVVFNKEVIVKLESIKQISISASDSGKVYGFSIPNNMIAILIQQLENQKSTEKKASNVNSPPKKPAQQIISQPMPDRNELTLKLINLIQIESVGISYTAHNKKKEHTYFYVTNKSYRGEVFKIELLDILKEAGIDIDTNATNSGNVFGITIPNNQIENCLNIIEKHSSQSSWFSIDVGAITDSASQIIYSSRGNKGLNSTTKAALMTAGATFLAGPLGALAVGVASYGLSKASHNMPVHISSFQFPFAGCSYNPDDDTLKVIDVSEVQAVIGRGDAVVRILDETLPDCLKHEVNYLNEPNNINYRKPKRHGKGFDTTSKYNLVSGRMEPVPLNNNIVHDKTKKMSCSILPVDCNIWLFDLKNPKGYNLGFIYDLAKIKKLGGITPYIFAEEAETDALWQYNPKGADYNMQRDHHIYPIEYKNGRYIGSLCKDSDQLKEVVKDRQKQDHPGSRQNYTELLCKLNPEMAEGIIVRGRVALSTTGLYARCTALILQCYVKQTWSIELPVVFATDPIDENDKSFSPVQYCGRPYNKEEQNRDLKKWLNVLDHDPGIDRKVSNLPFVSREELRAWVEEDIEPSIS